MFYLLLLACWGKRRGVKYREHHPLKMRRRTSKYLVSVETILVVLLCTAWIVSLLVTPANRNVAFEVKSGDVIGSTTPLKEESATPSTDKSSGSTTPLKEESGTPSTDKASSSTTPLKEESGTPSTDKASSSATPLSNAAAAEVAARGVYPEKGASDAEVKTATDAAIGAIAGLDKDASVVKIVQQGQGGAAAARAALKHGASNEVASRGSAAAAIAAEQAIQRSSSSTMEAPSFPEARFEAQAAAEHAGLSQAAAASAADAAASTAVVSEKARTLESASIVYTPPKDIRWKSSATNELDLSPQYSIEELKQQITKINQEEGANIQVSSTMDALLEGPDFTITPATPTRQAVSSQRITSWTWDIEPAKTGTRPLHMTLSALIDIQGELTPLAFKVYDDNVEVNETLPQHIEEFFSNNWQWLWAALLVPVVGWLWTKYKRWKANKGAG
jgi:hypothetical protein